MRLVILTLFCITAETELNYETKTIKSHSKTEAEARY